MKKLLIFITLITGFVYSQTHQVGSTTLQEREVVGNLDVPWEIKWGPDGYLWITERSGLVSRINVETGEKHVILDISNIVSTESESGLLGMEFHPDFENNHILFLVYTYYQGFSIRERLVAYTYDEVSDALINSQILINGIDGYSTHIGCRLHALDDNTMLMSTGDAQDQPASQDLSELTGKFLRIDISDQNFGGIPADNPINNSYIWSWGHRNAQGLEVAPNGIIYSSEHGPNSDDELNIIEPNRNYGWPNVSLGTRYGGKSYIKRDLTNRTEEPIFSFLPAIAPSDLNECPDNLKQYYKDFDCLIGLSLREMSLIIYLIDPKKNKLASYEKIYERVKSDINRIRHIPSIRPVEGGYLNSSFGYRQDPIDNVRRFHQGQDFAVPTGTPIFAPADGLVKRAYYIGGFGNHIKLEHASGYTTTFSHLSKIFVRHGQKIKRGDVIGETGNTGRSTAPHLHYEVHYHGTPKDPLDYFFSQSGN